MRTELRSINELSLHEILGYLDLTFMFFPGYFLIRRVVFILNQSGL